MKRFLFGFLFLASNSIIFAQVSSKYTISFENAVHHEAFVEATFSNLKTDDIEFRMSRTSPGRYALHEFMKNIYDVKVTDGEGNVLDASRPDPYSWKIKGHDGTIKVSYILFANRGGGTYAQIDETHAHLNIPATFIYAPSLENDAIEVTFNVRNDLNWKVATQLKPIKGNTYYAENLQYFMDSPTEISNFSKRSFDVEGQTLNFVLHHNGTEEELDTYFEQVKKIVLQEKAVYGELPKFDYGNYTFLACYIPNASGDGMEHRNSTILTNTRSLADGGISGNIGTVSHEFFHSWNVERIRPKSLEPFKFDEANMSGELWFAEGFTSYYTTLILCRAGLINQEKYINGIVGTFNYVWNSPGRQFFNPIEMSYQAPFVDAARSVDPVNRSNTFISYYSYGNMLGLALDLSLREKELNLDDYMKLVWKTFGKQEIPYTVEDLRSTLNTYAGDDFGNYFFDNYIYKSNMPDMKRLLNNMGVILTQDNSKIDFGATVRNDLITENTTMKSSAYNAGLENDDKIIQVNDVLINETTDFDSIINSFKPNDRIKVTYERLGETKEANVILEASKNYTLSLFEANNLKLDKKAKALRESWLQAK
ncbi:Predicted metalloprotease, contains C-terminal PDZ domain [Flaviramulus basaltis]|uniref:Predicted metalloprotease, contains C-terminal PDZ domain n=1 Tax=Flaviramulus basaltis TaxID=369401 RepID=A0A1K2IC64_9FLAO|nr:PDZ domain-containing protein [Flaviramulus basaltis]SFZ89838.1 Predicted metalloprotease, contains C-terminal PDZ domain [Flaviramulus basaltis]